MVDFHEGFPEELIRGVFYLGKFIRGDVSSTIFVTEISCS